MVKEVLVVVLALTKTISYDEEMDQFLWIFLAHLVFCYDLELVPIVVL